MSTTGLPKGWYKLHLPFTKLHTERAMHLQLSDFFGHLICYSGFNPRPSSLRGATRGCISVDHDWLMFQSSPLIAEGRYLDNVSYEVKGLHVSILAPHR